LLSEAIRFSAEPASTSKNENVFSRSILPI
jgi:hypothetical protein